jgi:hypothetical protein
MNWKRLLMIAVVAGGFAFAAAPSGQAQHVSFGVSFGTPGYYGYGHPYGYGYARPVYYNPYGYTRVYHRPYYRPRYRPVRHVRGHYHVRHGRSYFCTRVHRRW